MDSEEELDSLLQDEDIEQALYDKLPQPMTIDDFEVRVQLAKGRFSTVHMAVHKGMGEAHPLVVKMVKKKAIFEQKLMSHAFTERALLYRLAHTHPFICRFGGFFHDPQKMYYVFEFCAGGDFWNTLRQQGKLNRNSAMFYAASALLVVEYLHTFNVAFRDLKPENMLLDRDGYLKLTDFGLSKVIPQRSYTFCGTAEYIAPEMVLRTGHGTGVDWWALGIIMYEMFVGQPPFIGRDPMDIFKNILKGKLRFPQYMKSDTKDLVRRLLRPSLLRRIGCSFEGSKKIVQHKFFKGMDWDGLFNKKLGRKQGAIVPNVGKPSDTTAFVDQEELRRKKYEEDKKKKEDAMARAVGVEVKETFGGEDELPWPEQMDPFKKYFGQLKGTSH